MDLGRWASPKNEDDGLLSAQRSSMNNSGKKAGNSNQTKKSSSKSTKSKNKGSKSGSQDSKKQKNSKKQKDSSDNLPKVKASTKKEKEKIESKEISKENTKDEVKELKNDSNNGAIDSYMRAITEQEKKTQEKFIQVKIVSYHDGSILSNQLMKPNMTVEDIKLSFQRDLELLPPRPDDESEMDFPTQLLPGQILRVGDTYNEGKELATPHLTDDMELSQAWELSPFGVHQRLRRFIKKSGHRIITVGRVGARLAAFGGGGSSGSKNSNNNVGSPKLPKLPVARGLEKGSHSKQNSESRMRLLLYWERRTIDDDYSEALNFQAHAIAQHIAHGAPRDFLEGPTTTPIKVPPATASKSLGKMKRLASTVEGDREHEDAKIIGRADITTWGVSENERKEKEEGSILPHRRIHRKSSIFGGGQHDAQTLTGESTKTVLQQAETAASAIALREERRSLAGQRNAKKAFRETEEVRKGKLLLDIGKWQGVACSRGRFMKLHLARCSPPLMGALNTYPGFTNLSDMSRLNLSCNQLSGPIPGKDIARLFTLTQLKLSKNLLTGCIPKQLTQLKNLSELHISKNSLTGHVPGCLSSLTNLQVLDLSHNKLTGALPDELGELRCLRVMDISHNSLKGWLNKWVGMLGELQRLSLNHNRLVGRLPDSLSRLTVLEYLHLNSNRFEGDIIVASFSTMNPCMREIFLRGNAFYSPMRVDMSGDGPNGDDIEVDHSRWEKLLECKRNIENYFERCVVLV